MPSSVLIVGGGLAGLFCALKLTPHPVTVLATAPLGAGASSVWAQGGIAAAMSDGDTPEKHTADTVAAGAGLVDEAMALGMAREAGDRVHDLLAYGVPFDRDLAGHLVQSREAAHSERRIVRVGGDMAGAAIMAALVAAVRTTPSITVYEGEAAEKLVVQEGRIAGVITRNADGATRQFHASEVVLATGGIGHLYALTTNPPEACGIGLAMAAEAGAIIADAEFVQFHPTAIDIGRDPAPLATEALRGEGATLINAAGERFMMALHPDAELGPRDTVARGVFEEVRSGRGAFLDCRSAIGAHFAARFPTVYKACLSAGIDPVTKPIPIAPAEHYHMGGILTDETGHTSLPGLWAVGEVASTGVHGANRLASNSLLEAIVFASRIAAAMPPSDAAVIVGTLSSEGLVESEEDAVSVVRETMTRHVGVIRDGAGLTEAISTITALENKAKTRKLVSICQTALMIATAAALRHESRGGHFRSDYPETDPQLAHRSRLTLTEARAAAIHFLKGS